ncbi:MAG TPA: hypothetical protein VME46_04385 [Acidimicrobiales bacterium]|nr:hypothetical protein [Acidimicrobiales bacterium]
MAAVVLAAALVSGCASAGAPRAGASPVAAAPNLPTPMANSVETSQGTWATIPMGRLDDPLNTFWQLFYRPRAGSSWSDKVEATATATNGGLVLASEGKSLLVAVRPSANLTFTPMISTSDEGRSWSNGLLTKELAARPDALALAGTGAIALAGSGPGAEVLAAGGDISTWRSLVTQAALAASASGQACGLGALTAVGYLGAQPLVGASCASAGVAGLFALANGSWHLVGPRLPYPFRGGRTEVLAVRGFGPGVLALLAVAVGGRSQLVLAASGAGRRWAISRPLVLEGDEQVASFGPGGPGQFFALLRGSSGTSRLFLTDAAGLWRELPPPPAGTATIVFSANRPTDALVARGAQFSAWSLGPRAKSWAKGQVTHVPLQYGSSS